MNPLRGDDPQLNSVVEAIHAAIPASLAELARRASPEALAGYALCTDNDERTLYATAYRMADLDSFRWRTFRYLPAEWPLEDFSEPIAAASRALERWADHHYSIEPDSVNPSDAIFVRGKRSPLTRSSLFSPIIVLQEHFAVSTSSCSPVTIRTIGWRT